ncbi:MAG: hypothetical protein DRI69_11920, partial [Bacteroidetes bacterium]
MRLLIYLFLSATLLGTGSCNEGSSGASSAEDATIFDTQYLPDGVERAEHRAYIPDGSNFQGAR